MTTRKLLSFLLRSVTAGLALAFVVLVLRPDLLPQRPAVVEMQQSAPQEPAPATLAPRAQGPVSYATAVDRAVPAVVNVYSTKRVAARPNPLLNDPLFRYFFGDRQPDQQPQRLQTSLGSGVIVSPQGYVLTNHHVVAGAEEIQVLLADGRSAAARVVGSDPDTDLAVLHIDLTNLPSIVIGDSSRLRVGDVVLAIGDPFGVGQTVTMGIVSATGRNQLGINTYEDFIQTDAAINPGNSGGALVNAYGELVGINTAIFSQSGGSQGIGFAIPVSLAKGVMTQIIEHGHVVRGWLGIVAQDLTPALADSFGLADTRGVVVAGILGEGPAAQAGLQPGDVLTRIGDTPLDNARQAMNIIARLAPGTTVPLAGMRAGKPFQTKATVAQRPPSGQ